MRRFPKRDRYIIGERVLDLFIDVLVAVSRAERVARSQKKMLLDASDALDETKNTGSPCTNNGYH